MPGQQPVQIEVCGSDCFGKAAGRHEVDSAATHILCDLVNGHQVGDDSRPRPRRSCQHLRALVVDLRPTAGTTYHLLDIVKAFGFLEPSSEVIVAQKPCRRTHEARHTLRPYSHNETVVADLHSARRSLSRAREQAGNLGRVPFEDAGYRVEVHRRNGVEMLEAEIGHPLDNQLARQLAVKPWADHRNLGQRVGEDRGGQGRTVSQRAAQPCLVPTGNDVTTDVDQNHAVEAEFAERHGDLSRETARAATGIEQEDASPETVRKSREQGKTRGDRLTRRQQLEEFARQPAKSSEVSCRAWPRQRIDDKTFPGEAHHDRNR